MTLPSFEVFGQGLGAGVAAGGILIEALEADRFQFPVHLSPEAGRRRRFSLGNLAQDLQRRGTREWRAAREQFVENRPQGIHVRRGGHSRRTAGGLLGCHVGRGADHRAGDGEGGFLLREFRDPEINEMRHTRGIQEHIGGLEVAVNDAPAVGIMHRPGCRDDQRGDAVGRSQDRAQRGRFCRSTAVQDTGQTAAFHQRHGIKQLAFGGPGLDDRNNVRVLEGGERILLRTKSRQRLRGGLSRTAADHFQCHHAAQRPLTRPPHHSHAAAAHGLHPFVVPEALTHHARGIAFSVAHFEECPQQTARTEAVGTGRFSALRAKGIVHTPVPMPLAVEGCAFIVRGRKTVRALRRPPLPACSPWRPLPPAAERRSAGATGGSPP